MRRLALIAALTAMLTPGAAGSYELSDIAGDWDCEQGDYENGAWMRGYYTIAENGAASLNAFFREIEGEDTTKVRFKADIQVTVAGETMSEIPQSVTVTSAEFNGEAFEADVRDVYRRILMTAPQPGTIESLSPAKLVYERDDTVVTCLTRDETRAASTTSAPANQLALRGRCKTGDCE